MLLESSMQSFVELGWLKSVFKSKETKSYEEAEDTVSGTILTFFKAV